MNGAQSLIQTLVNGGVEVCFTNPGTSEIHFVAAVDQVEGMRTVLGLFEGVCTGAADGYARMTGRPAATLLHLGPGLANGLANLHNARRAFSPVVNIVGNHAIYHLPYDSPLTSDIVSLAKPVSGWIRSTEDVASTGADAAAAIAAAQTPPGQVATLIVPADCAWSEGGVTATVPTIPQPTPVESKTISQVAEVLRRGEPAVMLMTGPALMDPGLSLASCIAQATGVRLMFKSASRLQRGAGRVRLERFPYPVEQALKTLQGTAHLILVGEKPPITFFAYPDAPSWLTPESCQIHTLAQREEDIVGALEALVEELNAPDEPISAYEFERPDLPRGDITPEKVWASLAVCMPEEAIIVDESITSGRGAQRWAANAPPHDWLFHTGGAIGFGMPVAIGASVACPDRKVITMQSDGSAMYTVQALWTQAREGLDIVTVLFSNRTYAILQVELKRLGADAGGPKAQAMLDLGNPNIGWVKLAQGLGVNASRATTIEAFNQQLESAIKSNGPHLIEVVL